MAMAAGSAQPPLLVFFLAACFLLPCLSLDARKTNDPPLRPQFSFSFDFSNASSYRAGDLRLEGNASLQADKIDLTCVPPGSMNNCAGRVSYSHPVPFHDGGATLASFSTRFTFAIEPNNGTSPGDGMAFFLAGYPSRMTQVYYDGANLGLLSETTDDHFVAVEFDTFKNYGDPSDKHIGIDVNSIVSSNTTDLPLQALEGTMTATVQFDNVTRMLAATLRFHDNPYIDPAVVSYVLQDPRSLLPREVAVGFSAATGRFTELHQILAWSFNSTFAAPTPPKVPPPPPDAVADDKKHSKSKQG